MTLFIQEIFSSSQKTKPLLTTVPTSATKADTMTHCRTKMSSSEGLSKKKKQAENIPGAPKTHITNQNKAISTSTSRTFSSGVLHRLEYNYKIMKVYRFQFSFCIVPYLPGSS